MLARHIKKALRSFGYQVIRREPLLVEDIPPCSCQLLPAGRDNYWLPSEYRSRLEISYCDNTYEANEWQQEVYPLARLLADAVGCRSVADVGCGSAYKLLRHFADYDTVGVDVPETVKWLKAHHEGREWVSEDVGECSSRRVDLVIASDVIEHLLQPDQVLGYIQSMEPRLVVLSTPTRSLFRDGHHGGPPRNPCHIREWDFAEFHCFVAAYFDIVHHLITNPAQTTQMIVCRPLQSERV